ncbi:MAG TPA: hypothetical protein GXZ95_00545 [Mollicutes bacterium]|nr:hypothetical protein [Mollicutes bacterium]
MKSIKEILEYVLKNYKDLQKHGFAGNELNSIFNNEIPLVFLMNLNYQISML